MSSLAIRRRRPRFSVEELKALVGAVESVHPALFGPRTSHILNSDTRDRTWVEISKVVNTVSQVKRSAIEIRKKWADWTSVVRKKSVKNGKGVGKHHDTVANSSRFLTPTERRLLTLLQTKSELNGGACESGDNLDMVKLEVESESLDNSLMEESLGLEQNEDFSSTESATTGLWQAKEEMHQQHYNTSISPQEPHQEHYNTSTRSQEQHQQHYRTSARSQESHQQHYRTSTRSQESHQQHYRTSARSQESHQQHYRTPKRSQNVLSAESTSVTSVQTHSLGGNSPDEIASSTFHNGDISGNLKLNGRVEHADALLALKRKKLGVLEEQLKVDRERLEVEKGILQILKEINSKYGSNLL